MDVIVCEQQDVEKWLKLMRWLSEATNTLIILDDCAASKDVKWRIGELVNLAFSARHMAISVDPEVDRHNIFFPGERGGDRPLLHPLGEDNESHLRRLRRRAFP